MSTLKLDLGPFEIDSGINEFADEATDFNLGLDPEFDPDTVGADLDDSEWEGEAGRQRRPRVPRFPKRPRPVMVRGRRRPLVLDQTDVEWEEEIDRKSRGYVRWVQRSLNQLLRIRLAVDGIIGPKTRSAIRRFQRVRGLAVDGIVGPRTERALVAAGAGQPPGSTPIPSLPPTGSFTPIAVEERGGGRIKDKTAPSKADLVSVGGVGGKRVQLHRLAARAWQALVARARKDGLRAPLLLPTSGYRSPQHQERLWRKALEKYGSPKEARKWVAPPGGSPHQSGRAIDFYLGDRNASENVSRLRTLPAYRWLVRYAEQYGFYPYQREPWHWEYNPPAVAKSGGTRGTLGRLTISSPERYRFSYEFTPEDLVWTARFIIGEAGGTNDLDNHAVIWAMFNRYAFFTHKYYRTFHQFLRAYSTPLQPSLKSWAAAKRHMHKTAFVKTGGFYAPPHDDIPRGQLKSFLKLQNTPWNRLKPSARQLAEQALKGQIPNPIGNASEFGNTRVYFRSRYKRNPTRDEWIRYTRNYAKRKKWKWIGTVVGMNQMKENTFFIQKRIQHLPKNTIRVVSV